MQSFAKRLTGRRHFSEQHAVCKYKQENYVKYWAFFPFYFYFFYKKLKLYRDLMIYFNKRTIFRIIKLSRKIKSVAPYVVCLVIKQPFNQAQCFPPTSCPLLHLLLRRGEFIRCLTNHSSCRLYELQMDLHFLLMRPTARHHRLQWKLRGRLREWCCTTEKLRQSLRSSVVLSSLFLSVLFLCKNCVHYIITPCRISIVLYLLDLIFLEATGGS